MAAIKTESGRGRVAPRPSRAKAKRGGSSSAAGGMSKATKAAYAKAYPAKSQRNKPKRTPSANRKAPIGNRSYKRAPGFDPFDAIGNLGRGLGDAVKNAFGQAVPQDVMFKSITDRIKDATGR